MLTQGTCYTDTAKTVKDAQAIRDYAKKRFVRAQTMLEQQTRQRQEENKRTEVLLQERVRVVHELCSPSQQVATRTTRSVESSILDLATTTVELEASVRVAQDVHEDLLAAVAGHQAVIAGNRATREHCLAELESVVSSVGSATQAMERELETLTREEHQLLEQNKFLEAQLFLKASPPEPPAVPTSPTPVSLNGYSVVVAD